MDIEKALLENFKKIYEKEESLSLLTNEDLFKEFSNSEVHVIDLIGKGERVNGVFLASKLAMTRGAISKITSRLIKKNLIIKYKLAENKKEVYYKLTDLGWKVFEDHRLAHDDWEKRELDFFKSLAREEKELINSFLEKYNNHLSNLIKERS